MYVGTNSMLLKDSAYNMSILILKNDFIISGKTQTQAGQGQSRFARTRQRGHFLTKSTRITIKKEMLYEMYLHTHLFKKPISTVVCKICDLRKSFWTSLTCRMGAAILKIACK
jgi:hypothetical protein